MAINQMLGYPMRNSRDLHRMGEPSAWVSLAVLKVSTHFKVIMREELTFVRRVSTGVFTAVPLHPGQFPPAKSHAGGH